MSDDDRDFFYIQTNPRISKYKDLQKRERIIGYETDMRIRVLEMKVPVYSNTFDRE